MLTNSAKEKYGITNGPNRAWEISKDNWRIMVNDFDTKLQCAAKTGLDRNWLKIQEVKYGYGWSNSTTVFIARPGGIYDKMIWEKLKEEREKIGNRYANYTGRIYAIACLHSVFVDYDYLLDFLEREKEGLKTGLLLIVGDIFDYYNVSLFKKEYYDVTIPRELQVVKELMAIIKTYCPNIILVPGNHDSRAHKRFMEQTTPEVRASLSVTDEALASYCKRKQIKQTDIDNILLLSKGNVISYLAEMTGSGDAKTWYCKIGDAIFCHPEKGVGTPLQTALRAQEHFSDRDEAKAVVVFHTHKASSAYYRHWFIGEGGCMSRRMDYMEGPVFNKSLPVCGYFRGEMKKGTLDFSRSAVFALGACR